MSDEVVSSEAQPARSAPREGTRSDGPRSDGPRGAAGGQRRERKPGGAAGGDRRAGGGANRRRKFCRFCAEKELVLDYKDPDLLGQFITERYKIIPARVTGACAKHQRALTTAIKRARMIALLPFTTLHND